MGFLVGALIWGVIYTSVFPVVSAVANIGSTTLPAALEIDLWPSILLFLLVTLALTYFLERHGELRRGGLGQ
ncbi:MAG: hypothetical protein ACYC7H_12000 [Chloroflexota bacterium]